MPSFSPSGTITFPDAAAARMALRLPEPPSRAPPACIISSPHHSGTLDRRMSERVIEAACHYERRRPATGTAAPTRASSPRRRWAGEPSPRPRRPPTPAPPPSRASLRSRIGSDGSKSKRDQPALKPACDRWE
jgi:hypothetical protein